MRTRMYGGVGGEEPRAFPLSRLVRPRQTTGADLPEQAVPGAALEAHDQVMEQFLSQLSAGIAAVVERSSALAVAVEARPRMGSSGILWQNGVIVTADHAVRSEDEIQLVLPDGNHVKARLAGRDPGSDLAVLTLDGVSGPAFERNQTIRAGELIVAVGRYEPGPMASLGLISTAAGPWRTWRGGQLDRLLRLDISAYPRSSGAVIVDVEGRVAGMLTGGLTRTAPVAVPVETIDRVVGEILAHGRVARGYLGVGLQPIPLPAPLANALGREQRTALIVLNVEAAGPAETAGILLGDILVGLNGKTVTDTDDVQMALEGSIGTEVTAVVFRGGQHTEVRVKVGERRA